MSGRNLAIIVAALHPRSGATLWRAPFADYFILSHENPLIFDTDGSTVRSAVYFPHRANVVDIDRVRARWRCSICWRPGREKRVSTSAIGRCITLT